MCCSASSYSKLSKTTSLKVLAKMVNKLLCLETLKICMIISKFCQNVTASENFQLKCKHQLAAHCVTQVYTKRVFLKLCGRLFIISSSGATKRLVPHKSSKLSFRHQNTRNVGKIIQNDKVSKNNQWKYVWIVNAISMYVTMYFSNILKNFCSIWLTNDYTDSYKYLFQCLCFDF